MDIAETMGVWVGYKYACSCSFIHCFAIVSAVVSTLLNFVTMFRRAHEDETFSFEGRCWRTTAISSQKEVEIIMMNTFLAYCNTLSAYSLLPIVQEDALYSHSA